MRALLGIFVAACLVSAAACNRRSEPAGRYTVRGQVKYVAPDRTEIELHHEAIPEFINLQGERVGMPSMSMPFVVARPELLDALPVGAKVEVTFEVHAGARAGVIVAAEPLPPDTPLALSGR